MQFPAYNPLPIPNIQPVAPTPIAQQFTQALAPIMAMKEFEMKQQQAAQQLQLGEQRMKMGEMEMGRFEREESKAQREEEDRQMFAGHMERFTSQGMPTGQAFRETMALMPPRTPEEARERIADSRKTGSEILALAKDMNDPVAAELGLSMLYDEYGFVATPQAAQAFLDGKPQLQQTSDGRWFAVQQRGDTWVTEQVGDARTPEQIRAAELSVKKIEVGIQQIEQSMRLAKEKMDLARAEGERGTPQYDRKFFTEERKNLQAVQERIRNMLSNDFVSAELAPEEKKLHEARLKREYDRYANTNNNLVIQAVQRGEIPPQDAGLYLAEPFESLVMDARSRSGTGNRARDMLNKPDFQGRVDLNLTQPPVDPNAPSLLHPQSAKRREAVVNLLKKIPETLLPSEVKDFEYRRLPQGLDTRMGR